MASLVWLLLLLAFIVLMFLYAVATGVFFTFLWKHDHPHRIRFFFLVFLSLFLGGLAMLFVTSPKLTGIIGQIEELLVPYAILGGGATARSALALKPSGSNSAAWS